MIDYNFENIPVGPNIELILHEPNPKYPILSIDEPNIRSKKGDTMIVFYKNNYYSNHEK